MLISPSQLVAVRRSDCRAWQKVLLAAAGALSGAEEIERAHLGNAFAGGAGSCVACGA